MILNSREPCFLVVFPLENLSGMKDDSLRSDIFFLGTIAYLALTGKPALKETRERAERSDPRRYTSIEPIQRVAPGLPRDVADLVSRMIALDPMERWQTAADVRRALEPLVQKYRDGAVPTAAAEKGGPVSAPAKQGGKGTLMVVETGDKSQEVLRRLFTGLGYRVLITENPERALGRFSTTPPPADCLVVSAHTLGESAVEAFNRLSTDPFFAPVPAVLLLGSRQHDLAARVAVDERRRTVEAPLKPSEIGALLETLIKK